MGLALRQGELPKSWANVYPLASQRGEREAITVGRPLYVASVRSEKQRLELENRSARDLPFINLGMNSTRERTLVSGRRRCLT